MDSKIKNFTDLLVWQYGHKLVIQVYALTSKFPKDEVFGVTNQMRHCAVSLTSNIAEGFGRGTLKDKLHFYLISAGSLYELQNQTIICRDVGYMTKNEYDGLEFQIVEVQKLINGLIKKTKTLIHDS